MNKTQTADFFPGIDEEHLSLVAQDIYLSYRETEEDLRYEEQLKEIEIQLNEQSGSTAEDKWGDLAFDEEADRQRWNELENDFERVIQTALRLR